MTPTNTMTDQEIIVKLQKHLATEKAKHERLIVTNQTLRRKNADLKSKIEKLEEEKKALAEEKGSSGIKLRFEKYRKNAGIKLELANKKEKALNELLAEKDLLLKESEKKIQDMVREQKTTAKKHRKEISKLQKQKKRTSSETTTSEATSSGRIVPEDHDDYFSCSEEVVHTKSFKLPPQNVLQIELEGLKRIIDVQENFIEKVLNENDKLIPLLFQNYNDAMKIVDYKTQRIEVLEQTEGKYQKQIDDLASKIKDFEFLAMII